MIPYLSPDPFRFAACSVRSDEYGSDLGITCTRCNNGDGRVAIVVVIAVLEATAFVTFVAFVVSTDKKYKELDQGIAALLARIIPLQSFLKIAFVSS